MCESIAASCTLEPPKASVSIPCTRSSRSTPHPNFSSPKVPSQRGKAPGGFTSSPRVPIGIGHVICPPRTTPSPGPPGHHREYIASEGLTIFSRACMHACVHHPRWSTRRKISWQEEPLPPEGGSLDSKTYIFHQPPTRQGVWRWGALERRGSGQLIVPPRAPSPHPRVPA